MTLGINLLKCFINLKLIKSTLIIQKQVYMLVNIYVHGFDNLRMAREKNAKGELCLIKIY